VRARTAPGFLEVLAHITPLPRPPFVIVTSRLADDELWSEALNLGAYDVLAKPFEATEVTRIVSLAWLHWSDRYGISTTSPDRQKAAGTVT
jgi:DNA-binding response OmpR family regulator